MKRITTLAVALMIAGFAFGQKTAKNPLVSEQNYKHPFAASAAKENSTTEKFGTEKVQDAGDYKHPHSKKAVKRVRVRQGSGASPAASHKHPLG